MTIEKSAVESWGERVAAQKAQSERAMAGRPQSDLWLSLAEAFRADPRRTDDPVLEFIAGWLRPESTVLDVGGGAGRLALPLALRCKHVTVVDPSPSMNQALMESAREAGIDNVSVVSKSWEDADVEPHDVVICAHVVYAFADIAGFVRKLDRTAGRVVAIAALMEAPLSRMSPLWKAVHQQERVELPAGPELLAVLWELGIYPNVSMFPAGRLRGMPSFEAAVQVGRAFLYVEPGTEEDVRLEAALRDLTEETPYGLTMRGWSPPPEAIIWWRTDERIGR